MSDWDFIVAPSTVSVSVVLDEVAIPLSSLRMIGAENIYSGLHEWIGNTSDKLTDEQINANNRATGIAVDMYHLIDAQTFPEFANAITDIDPARLRETRLEYMREIPNYPGDEAILADREAFIDLMVETYREKLEKKGKEVDREHWGADWDDLHNPAAALQEASDHLNFMWDTYMQAEWQRVRPIIAEATEAFNAMNYDNMSAFEAMEAVTGRNMRGKGFFEEELESADHMVFMPSAHLGPYISWAHLGEEKQLVFFFGVRPPKDAPTRSVDLNRSELLVRLNALADETRLKILELLTENDELCAQDFITQLNLSQSSASRHLRQLTASGYLSERRRDVAKCYSLNPDRIDDTIQGLQQFLKKS